MVRTIYRVFKRSINKQNLNNENNVKISITFGSLFHIHILVCRFVLFSFFVLLLHINTFDYFFFSAFWYQNFICMIIGFPYLSIEGNLCWTLFQKMKYFKTRAFAAFIQYQLQRRKITILFDIKMCLNKVISMQYSENTNYSYFHGYSLLEK